MFKKRNIFLLLFLFQLSCAYGQFIIIPGPYDTSNTVVFRFQNDSTNISSSLTKSDILVIETLLSKSVRNYNNSHDRKRWRKPIIDLQNGKYARQLMLSLNSKGEIIVWVNCICRRQGQNSDWRKGLISADDGGNCYFNLKINLTTKEYFDLSVNGQG